MVLFNLERNSHKKTDVSFLEQDTPRNKQLIIFFCVLKMARIGLRSEQMSPNQFPFVPQAFYKFEMGPVGP